MSVKVRGLDEFDGEGCQSLHNLVKSRYLDGMCYEFALALTRATRWPMIGILHEGTIRHVVLRIPNGRLFDARGAFLEREIGDPFSIRPPYTLKTVSPSDLRKVRPLNERGVAGALKMAQALWPYLPWRRGPIVRVRAFAKDLEAISRKHRLWIFAPYATAIPPLAEGAGDEKGYTVTPSATGLSYMIARRLKDD